MGVNVQNLELLMLSDRRVKKLDNVFKFILEFNEFFQAVFGVSVASGVGILIKITLKRNDKLDAIANRQNELLHKYNSIEDRIIALEEQGELRKNASMASLHNNIYSFCGDIIKRGSVTIKELDNLEYLWKAYSGLNGNGTGEVLYKRVKSLPIVEDIDD